MDKRLEQKLKQLHEQGGFKNLTFEQVLQFYNEKERNELRLYREAKSAGFKGNFVDYKHKFL